MGEIGESIFHFHTVFYDNIVQGEATAYKEKY